MSLPTLSPTEAKRMLDQGAILVDIREADEHARENIPGARLMPLSRLDQADLAIPDGQRVIFHCRSGARTQGNAARLSAKAGLPVAVDRRQPLELQRQVQIGAGSMAFLGTMLGLFVSSWFFAIPAFVGAGLTMAGITGFCGMARILKKAPWNRAAYAHPKHAGSIRQPVQQL